jgi:hypothetical protein
VHHPSIAVIADKSGGAKPFTTEDTKEHRGKPNSRGRLFHTSMVEGSKCAKPRQIGMTGIGCDEWRG